MARLSADQWQAIRTSWEYDPDEPTFNEAARRASSKHNFVSPPKSSIDFRAKKDGWERRGSMNGIVSAAHRKADGMVKSDGGPVKLDDKPDASSAKKEQVARSESEDLRAEVIARHRAEWKQIAVLRQEALSIRANNPDLAFNKSKLAKINAEITAIQQAGERKAWGLDILVDPGSVKDMTDEQLAAIVSGKVAG